MTRGGTVLILVAGISALLAGMTVAFLARMRSSVEETAVFEAEVQARLMLVAACSYVCEASRIGYDTATDANHLEAFGWIDVRDGSEGPNTRSATSATDIVKLHHPELVERSRPGSPDRPAWPAKFGVARCPMHVMARPPYAVQLTATYNPIETNDSLGEFGKPLLKHRDPEPVMRNIADFLTNTDKTPRRESVDRSWFRVYRDGPATFVITVGGGGTHGWRDYNEALAAGPQYTEEFNNDPQYFELLRAQEVCMWYRVEWSPTVAPSEVHNIKNAWNKGPEDHYVSFPMNVSDSFRSQSHCRNFGGTIRWVQRLRHPPTNW